jgi:hypothetical protein
VKFRSAHRSPGRGLAAIRPFVARLLLWVYVVAAQIAPFAHLSTHRNDHTHGPELGAGGDAAHEAAHRAGQAHSHAPDDSGLTDEERAWLAGEDTPPASHSHGPVDHGRDSASHFGLALLQGPPPPLVPPPAETIAPPPADPLRGHDAPALAQPPARGPPA